MRWILGVALVGAAIFGCSASKPSNGVGSSGSGSGSSSGAGASGGTIGVGGPGIDVDGGDGVTPLNGSVVSGSGDTITVTGSATDVEFHVELADGSTAPDVVWTVDDTRIGSIDQNGVFHSDGYVGGVVEITATVGGAEATFDLTVNVDISENPGNLAEGAQQTLIAGGSADPAFKVLYPYDKTVFPRGLAAPLLQFAGAAASATLLAIDVPHFKYRQFAGASSPTRITLPEPVWRGLTLTAGAADTVAVNVTKASATAVTGPIASSWFVAPASLKGIIYYSSYKSPLADDKAAIMRVKFGQNAQVVQSGCTVCHTVSAQGNVLATGIEYQPNVGQEGFNNPVDSSSNNLTPDGQIAERRRTTDGNMFAFAGLSPDGSIALTNGLPPDKWPPYVPHGVYSQPGYASKLVDTTTATAISAPSLTNLVTYAQFPAFSPDGKHVTFINGDRLDERVLGVMDFDGTTTPPTFSNLRDLATSTTNIFAWPSFLADGAAVVYHQGDSPDSAGFNPDANGQSPPQYADLYLASLGDAEPVRLDALNGYAENGESYLPYGALEEGRMNYEPSALPVAVGGYYWVLFTSRRAYGNSVGPGTELETEMDPWGTGSVPSLRKKLWIAAVDVNYEGKLDPSHPALYVPGQELESGNMRGYAALAPCKAQGESCESGADCCDGFCRSTGTDAQGVPILACVPPPDDCSNLDELCETPDDCCNKANLCINNRCSLESVK